MSKKEISVDGSNNYEKLKNAVDNTDKEIEAGFEARENRKVAAQKSKTQRKKVYTPVVETELPDFVVEHFAKDDYDVRWVRFMLGGEEDIRYLSKREREGYEFVTAEELPEAFLSAIRIHDGKNHRGLVTSGDVCLMKVDKDLRRSRIEHLKKKTDNQVSSVDIYTYAKKGFRDIGSKSSVSVGKEPTFQ